jgi:hypothetical protein
MKKVLVLLSLLFATSVTFGQNLTVGQFLELSTKSLGEIEEQLTGNNWFFYQGVDETPEAFGNAKFVYDRPEFKIGDAAQYFITYYYSEDESANSIEFSLRNKVIYDSYLEQMQNLKFELKDSKTDNGNIVKVYKRLGFIIEVTIPPNFEKANSYKFMFAKKSDYKKIRR